MYIQAYYLILPFCLSKCSEISEIEYAVQKNDIFFLLIILTSLAIYKKYMARNVSTQWPQFLRFYSLLVFGVLYGNVGNVENIVNNKWNDVCILGGTELINNWRIMSRSWKCFVSSNLHKYRFLANFYMLKILIQKYSLIYVCSNKFNKSMELFILEFFIIIFLANILFSVAFLLHAQI